MKKKRQTLILNIINEQSVENQEMLREALHKRGFEVTQATISRDITELNLEKGMNDDGVYCYVPSSRLHGVKFRSLFAQSVLEIDCAGNIVCIKCHSGLANAACAALDTMNYAFIVGTIAGDDTIFVLVRTAEDAASFSEKLKELL